MKTLFSTILIFTVLTINANAQNPLLDAMTPSYQKQTENFTPPPEKNYIKYDLGPVAEIPKGWKLVSVTTDKGAQFLWFQDNIGNVHMMYGVFNGDARRFTILQFPEENYTLKMKN